MKLEIGCGTAKSPGYVGMDRIALPGVDIVHDLEAFPWPVPDASVSEVRAHHVLEHLHALPRVMEEIHRVLEPRGVLTATVPYYRHEGAFRDPTHVRFFTERTMEYFTEESSLSYYSRARFKTLRILYGWEGGLSWHIDHHVPPALRTVAHRLLLNRRATLTFVLEKA